jgi:hypothetical protein
MLNPNNPPVQKPTVDPPSNPDPHPKKALELPATVKVLTRIVDEETAYRVIDRLELEARRRAGVTGRAGIIVFDRPYGDFAAVITDPEPTPQTKAEHEEPNG